MSAYSDWKVGAITDEEYKQIAQRESRKDEYAYEHEKNEREEDEE